MKRSIEEALGGGSPSPGPSQQGGGPEEGTSQQRQQQLLIPSPGQAQMSTASSAQRLTTTDALTYLKAVKEIFRDKKDKYDEFLDIMKDFKAQRVNTNGVTARVKELFKGHRDLVLGFNTFLPPGYRITLPLEEEPFLRKKPVEFEEAISFVNKIKARFHGDDHVYKSFLDILNMYRKDNKLIKEVYQEVSVLFQDHPDLLVEFTHFLPDIPPTASVHLAQPGRLHMPFGDDRGSPMTTPRSNYIDKAPAVPYPVRDQCADNQDSEWNHAEREKGTREVNDNNDWEDGDSSDHKRKIARRDDSLTDQFHQGVLQSPVSALCEKVQDRLQDADSYKKFCDCVRSYECKFVTTPQFRMLVANLLGEHPDLMEECEDLIAYVERIGAMRNNKLISRSLKGEDRDGDHHDREDRNKNKDFGNREGDRYDRGLPINNKDLSAQRMSSYASKEKFLLKPIQELDLSNCESCTPSYRLLPENYPIPTASKRTELGNQVLNDHWVSVTSGSEDYSFKHMRKNQYEESLFRCEDDRFELDMLLESVNATALRVEELLDSMNSHAIKLDGSFYIEDHLTALNLRCIERLYGDHGLDVMDVLKKNAPLALPVILTRLKQKQEEWAKCRVDFNKVWAEVYAKNYHKSLDHRSFYFKQQDAKNLSPKALLAEIKETSEKNQNEDEMVLSISAGYRQPIRPHIEFGYPDPEIHEDLYELMKFAFEEAGTPEQSEKMTKIWKNFVEILLGGPSHPDKAEGTEHVKANDQTIKNVAIVCEGTSSSLLIAGADIGSKVDGSPIAACGTDVLCPTNAPQSGASITPSSIMLATSVGSKQTGHPEEGTAHALGEMSVNNETASDLQIGSAGPTTLDFGTGATLNRDSQVSAGTKSTSFPTVMAPQAVKAQQGHDETEACVDIQCEEGKLPGGSNLNKKSFASHGNNTGTKALENPSKSSVSPKGTGGEKMCTEEAEGEPDLNANDEEMCTQGSTDCENASENGDASVSESADGEEDFPEEPDEDGAHDKAESEGEADCTADAQDNGVQPSTRRSLRRVKPLNMIVPPGLQGKEKNCEIFYGNDSFYILFRLHQVLYERMQSAKQHSTSPENKWRILNKASAEESYARFKEALHSLLNGSSDNTKFEDDCRAIIGAQSYVLFTLDKLIQRLVKQLLTISTEEVDIRLLQLYSYERSRGPEKFADVVYHENARFVVPEDNLYRIECRHFPARLTMQLMRNELDKPEVTAVSMDPNFAAYLNEELLSVNRLNPQRKEKPGVFLMRNISRSLTGDEMSDTDKVMEGVAVYNGLEIKIACNTLKAAYVLDTEDFLFRPKRFRKALKPTRKESGSSAEIPDDSAPRGRFYKQMCC